MHGELAMWENSQFQRFANQTEAHRPLEENAFVDETLTSHNNKETLDKLKNGIEEILKAGEFFLKTQ